MQLTAHNQLAAFGLVILELGLWYECGSLSQSFHMDIDNNNNGTNNNNNNNFSFFVSKSMPLRNNKCCKQNARLS